MKFLVNGESKSANILRWFKKEGKEYLVYNFNETKDDKYDMNYAVVVNRDNGVKAYKLDDSEWDSLKIGIEEIAKANYNKIVIVVDDVEYLEDEIIIESYKKFFLLKNITALFSENKKNLKSKNNINQSEEQKSSFLDKDDKYTLLLEKYQSLLKDYSDLLDKYIMNN